jgi:hypothetical protein
MSLPPSVLLAIAILVGAGGVYFNGPGLLRDYQLRNAALEPATEMKVLKAECRTYYWVYTSCGIDYAAPNAPAAQSLSYGFLGPAPRRDFNLMRPAHDRTLVVADIGLSYFSQRIAGFAAMLLAMALVAGLAWRRMGTA